VIGNSTRATTDCRSGTMDLVDMRAMNDKAVAQLRSGPPMRMPRDTMLLGANGDARGRRAPHR